MDYKTRMIRMAANRSRKHGLSVLMKMVEMFDADYDTLMEKRDDDHCTTSVIYNANSRPRTAKLNMEDKQLLHGRVSRRDDLDDA